MNNSSLFSWHTRDIIKGIIMAVLGSIVTGLYTSVSAGAFPLDWAAWKPILIGGLGMGLTYIIKNFFTNSKDEFLKKEAQ